MLGFIVFKTFFSLNSPVIHGKYIMVSVSSVVMMNSISKKNVRMVTGMSRIS